MNVGNHAHIHDDYDTAAMPIISATPSKSRAPLINVEVTHSSLMRAISPTIMALARNTAGILRHPPAQHRHAVNHHREGEGENDRDDFAYG